MVGLMLALPMGKRARNKLKGAEQPSAATTFVADNPLPSGCQSASLKDCDCCHARWSGVNGRMTRNADDGASEPVRHIVFEVVKHRPPTVQRIREDGRDVWDIWPLRFDAHSVRTGTTTLETVREWLCAECYAKAEAMGWDHWAAQRIWDISVQEEAEEQRERAWRSPSADSIEAATRMYRIDENGQRVGVRLVEGDVDQIVG